MLSDISSVVHFVGVVVFSFLCGVFTVILFLLYISHKFCKNLPVFDEKPKVVYERCQLGGLLHQNLNNTCGASTVRGKESCGFINALFAFIFREWRDTNQLQKWVLKKINIEFMEFMETKTASRLLQGIKVHDVSLGTNFPVFYSATIKEPFSFTDNELPECVTIELEMEYQGGFYLAIDVDLVFGKTAFLAVKIAYVKGRIRLQFSRHPCTHWSITFVEEPDIKFNVETSFETRQLPQLTSLIVNQIRRTIRRKHTLPHYKMRYNPFFSFQHPEKSPFDGFIADIPVQPAIMEVCVAACTRLLISSRGEKERYADSANFVIFATLSVNVESCVGKALLGLVSSNANISKQERTDTSEPGTSGLQASNAGKSTSSSTSGSTVAKSQSNSTFDSFQRSFLGIRKDTGERGRKKDATKSKATETPKIKKQAVTEDVTKKNESLQTTENTEEALEEVKERNDSVSSTSSSSSGPSYVMVAMNFGATLREESKDGVKSVIVENITEHNVHGQSGMKDGDTVVELNGVKISSLSQTIATIEKIRANKESFKFKVRRSRHVGPDTISLDENADSTQESDKSSGSIETESDHSDVDLEDYKDFVNISVQVAEFHRKRSKSNHNATSMPEKDQTPKVADGNKGDEGPRPHSSSMSAANESTLDAPYMTLVSSPTPSTSRSSLKTSSSSGNLATEAPKQDSKKEKEVENKPLTASKAIGSRSRSESPPVFRKYNTLPKSSSTPLKQHPKSAGSTKIREKDALDGKKKPESATPAHQRFLNLVAATTSVASPAGASEAKKSTSFRDLSDQPLPFPIPSRSTENLSFARVDDDPDSQLFKTSLVNSNQREYSWKNETFSFNIKEKHRYLNVRYWSQQVGKHGVLKNKPPQIVGCMAIPICELEMHCRGVTSRRVTRRYPLSSPNELPHDHKWFLNDPVSHRSSFREQYCFGDTTLNISLQPKPGNKNNSSNCPDTAGTYFPNDETNGVVTKEMLSRMSRKTGSDYLLSAATENGRKLLVSRQTQTAVTEEDIALENADDNNNPMTTNDPELPDSLPTSVDKDDSIKEKLSLSQFIRGIIQGKKDSQEEKMTDTASVDLKAETPTDNSKQQEEMTKKESKKKKNWEDIKMEKSGFHQFEPAKFSSVTKCACCHNKVWTKSGLRCKRCSTVCHKRCAEKFKSGEQCPGSKKNETLDSKREDSGVALEEETDSSDNSTTALPSMAIDFRNKMLGISATSTKEDGKKDLQDLKKKSKNAEDLLAVNAKEMGRDLHRDLPLSERKAMLESQMQKVEDELHCEIEEKEQLLKEQGQLSSSTREWKKIERKVYKSDERLQALALLLLHYRAGLEDCEFEAGEEQSTSLDGEPEESTLQNMESQVKADSEEALPKQVTRDLS